MSRNPWTDHPPELFSCPFCGLSATCEMKTVDVGRGEEQDIFIVGCFDEDCPIGPQARVAGQHGIKQDDDLSNLEAAHYAVEMWNCRADT